MRTLALALAAALPVWLAAPAAHALCTTGVECVRERFGADTRIRNNRIIDRTDRLGDRGRPENPYLAGQNVPGQARRAGRFDRTLGGTAGALGRSATDPLRPGETDPDARYAPGSLIPGEVPSELQAAPDPTVERYSPAQPATGAFGEATPEAQATVRGRSVRPAAPVRRDPNRPQGAAELRSATPRAPGADR